MRFRLNSLYISGTLLTLCLLSIVPSLLRLAATWRQRNIIFADRYSCYNWESLLAIASLALIITALLVLWTGYWRGMRSAWFVMFVFVFIYFVPVYFGDTFLSIWTEGPSWWHRFISGLWRGDTMAAAMLRHFIRLAAMLVALFLPLRVFFGKPRTSHSGSQAD